MNIETQLREELHRTDDTAHMPPGTIDRALRTARTQRNRRRAGVALGAVACAAAVTVPAVTLRHSGQQAAGPPKQSLLVGEYETFSGHTSITDRILDPETGRYVTEPQLNGKRVLDVSFAPDGRNVLFRSNTYDFHYYLESTADFAAGRVSKAALITPAAAPGTMAGSAQWSPDGRSILLPYYKYRGTQQAGFSIYDVASHKTGPKVTLPSVDRHVTWAGSTEIVGTFAAVGTAPANSARFYSLNGKLRSQVTISGGGVAKLGRFSPTGRYGVLDNDRVYDMRTQRLLPEPKLPSCSEQALPTPDVWYSSDSYLIACSNSPEINVVNVDGQVERTIKLPFGSSLMPNTSRGKAGRLDGVTFAGTAGFPGSGGIRF